MAAEEGINLNFVVNIPPVGPARTFALLALGLRGVGQSMPLGQELRFTLKCLTGMQEQSFALGETDTLTRLRGSDDHEYREFDVRTVANFRVGVFRFYNDQRGLVFVP